MTYKDIDPPSWMTDRGTPVNAQQIGGKHYKTAIEHWDFVMHNGLNYLEGNATKYITRARKKNGLEDLRKGLHYVDKLVVLFDPWSAFWARWFRLRSSVIIPGSVRFRNLITVEDFARANDLTPAEEELVDLLSTWQDRDELELARARLILMIQDAARKP